MSDPVKLSELRAAVEMTGPRPLESLPFWSPGDRWRVELLNAAPALLEIVDAAFKYRSSETTIATEVDARVAFRMRQRLDSALRKVTP